MQHVDPFIPIHKPPQAAKQSPPRPRNTGSVDGFLHTPAPARYQSQPQQPHTPPPPPRAAFVHPRQASPAPALPRQHPARQQPQPNSHIAPVRPQTASAAASTPAVSSKKALPKNIGQVIFLLFAVTLGFLVQSVIIGQILLLVYAVFVLVRRVASRTTFLMALIALGVVLVSSLRADLKLAGTFAVYAFLLLAIGTITLTRETRSRQAS